ncbi:MAG: O-acetyl-ADP-ribose deacetylase [Oscillospiraceae bacterium]|nr:O-acetyl-ADP-ribose deacetylase [Oscillospiraceae bacterium]
MPFQIVRNDITKMHVDAIVNAANTSLLGGGGVDGAIHRAAGPELLAECRTLGGCATGDAKITAGYRLPAKYVIHTVGPRWKGGTHHEADLLASCYRRSLALAEKNGCESVAFPLISAGAYRFPKDQAIRIAVNEISAFLLVHDMAVILVVFGGETLALGQHLSADLKEYIDDQYVDSFHQQYPQNRREELYNESIPFPMPDFEEEPFEDTVCPSMAPMASPMQSDDLEERIHSLDESFQQMLFRKIDASGMTDAQCYRKANIDRKLFSKIRGDVQYRPSKPTAVAFAIALELELDETEELLGKAGFALSRSNRFDVIIRYFLERKNYNIFEINEALFCYDQVLLGGL